MTVPPPPGPRPASNTNRPILSASEIVVTLAYRDSTDPDPPLADSNMVDDEGLMDEEYAEGEEEGQVEDGAYDDEL